MITTPFTSPRLRRIVRFGAASRRRRPAGRRMLPRERPSPAHRPTAADVQKLADAIGDDYPAAEMRRRVLQSPRRRTAVLVETSADVCTRAARNVCTAVPTGPSALCRRRSKRRVSVCLYAAGCGGETALALLHDCRGSQPGSRLPDRGASVERRSRRDPRRDERCPGQRSAGRASPQRRRVRGARRRPPSHLPRPLRG